MCGISGFLDSSCDLPTQELERLVTRMSDAIIHRGPDDSGAWVDAESGVALGFRRLSIVDLTPTGHQPMVSGDARFIIVFNGEIYNFADLRVELENLGHNFRGRSDTEVILEALCQWGVEGAVPKLNGQFAMAVWDRKERLLHLIRDRLGIKPLYYGWMEGTLLFGSELKSMRAHPVFKGEIDRQSLTLYLRHNYIPAPRSIYKGVHKLGSGTIMTISTNGNGPRTGGLEKAAIKPYWSARDAAEFGVANPFKGTEQEAVEELDGLLRESVRLRMVAEVPLGAFLSGGVDSSTIVGMMQAQSGRPVKTFTIGFKEREYNEAEYAAAVARHLKTDHTELYVTPEEARSVIPLLPALYDEPFSDASQIPTYLVSKLTRRHVTVSLSGDGGDELFGGYNRYFWGRNIWGGIGWIPLPARKAIAGGLRMFSPSIWDRAFKRGTALLPADLRVPTPGDKVHKMAEVLTVKSPQELYTRLISLWKEPSQVVIGGDEPLTALSDRAQWPDVPDFSLWMMYLDLVSYLPDDILVKVDRASMGVSLEARVPYLDDHRVVEFAWCLPLSMKIKNGKGKWILRKVLDRYVPRELIERPKMGFGVPIDSWLRGPLRDWAEELLNVKKMKGEGFFNPEPIQQKWKEHLAGGSNWQYYLWDILVFQEWLRAV